MAPGTAARGATKGAVCGVPRYPPRMWFALVVALLTPVTGRIVVECPQYGRTVAVDRQPVGQTPLPPVDLTAGFHWVEVLDGNEALWSRLVYIAPGATLVLSVTLPKRGRRARGSVAGGPRAQSPASTYALRGQMGLVGAALGKTRHLAFDHRWHLDARRLGGSPLDAEVQALAYAPLEDETTPIFMPAFGETHRPLRLTTAALIYTDRDRVLRAGRHLRAAPTGDPFLLDGVIASARPRPWVSVTSALGRRALESGVTMISPLVAGAQLQTHGETAHLSVYGLYHDGAYVGAEGAMAMGAVDYTARLYSVDRVVPHAEAKARWRRDAGDLWLEGAFRREVEGGFERPRRFDDLLSPPPLREIRLRAGGQLRVGAFRLLARGLWRRGETLGPAHSPDIVGAHLRAGVGHGPSAPGLELTWRRHDEHDEEGPTLDGFIRARAVVVLGGCALAAGVIRLDLAQGERFHPEAHGRCAVVLARPLHLFARLTVEAVHPTLQPDGGPLVWGQMGIEIR